MEVSREERFLVFVLRCIAAIVTLAFGAALLPTEWMKSSHAWLGLGTFPDTTIMQYLTRSIALLYGFHGALCGLVSFQVRRLRPVVIFIGWMNTFFGLGMLAIDLFAGMPWYWTWFEGPPIAVGGVLVIYLTRFVPDQV
ncbi:hypothetical protein ABI59_23790 [Acidobacteria bacterium Mor1]|nr:hypothetical protein ABI59_23790 [Acidobacteria bacterium Mor1]